jgi:hypothetical protein
MLQEAAGRARSAWHVGHVVSEGLSTVICNRRRRANYDFLPLCDRIGVAPAALSTSEDQLLELAGPVLSVHLL